LCDPDRVDSNHSVPTSTLATSARIQRSPLEPSFGNRPSRASLMLRASTNIGHAKLANLVSLRPNLPEAIRIVHYRTATSPRPRSCPLPASIRMDSDRKCAVAHVGSSSRRAIRLDPKEANARGEADAPVGGQRSTEQRRVGAVVIERNRSIAQSITSPAWNTATPLKTAVWPR